MTSVLTPAEEAECLIRELEAVATSRAHHFSKRDRVVSFDLDPARQIRVYVEDGWFFYEESRYSSKKWRPQQIDRAQLLLTFTRTIEAVHNTETYAQKAAGS